MLYCFLLTNRTSWFSSPKLSEVPGFSSTSPLTHQFLCFDSLPLHEMTLIGINRNPINISEIFCLHLGQTLWANFTLGAMLPSASPTAFAEKPSLPLETLQARQALHPTLHMLPAASCTSGHKRPPTLCTSTSLYGRTSPTRTSKVKVPNPTPFIHLLIKAALLHSQGDLTITLKLFSLSNSMAPRLCTFQYLNTSQSSFPLVSFQHEW